MILPVHDRIRAHVSRVLATLYSLDADEQPAIVLDYPPSRDLGDLGTPVAFELARRLRKAPRVIAQEVAGAFGQLEGVDRVVAAPNGYLNFFLERPGFLLERLAATDVAPQRSAPAGKAIVEHTAINPNKAAHIGHLRNAALGDTLVRVLQFRGVPVEVQNYIDDTGVQVADVVVGFRALEGKALSQIEEIADTTRFDYYCWDLYARVTEWYVQDKKRLEVRAQTLHDIEHGGNENARIAAFIADHIVRCHLRTMARMNVDYDLLTWEGDILRLKFWAQAFDVLKAKKAVYLQEEGRLKGCWVMRIAEDVDSNPKSHIPNPNASQIPNLKGAEDAEDTEDAEEREKVIVRSNGTVTYVGKDIAYQFWKLGLLGKDFHYRVFTSRPHGPLWATCDSDGEKDHPMFGGAAYVYNVIDVRQSYLQKLLKQALIAVGHPEAAERSHHFSYEMVALSHATARELGYAPHPDSEEAKRPFVEVSGRKGLGVKADDLLDRLIEQAGVEVRKRNPEFSDAEADRIAQMIAIAAVRYFMVKFSRGKVIAFDIQEALSFEGESGPYLQYAVVRANNIFQKVQQRDGLDEAALLKTLKDVPSGELTGSSGNHELWSLVLEASRLDEIVEQVLRSLEFSVLAKYAFSLAQAFNAFYHRSPILNEERDDVRRWRAAAVIYLRNQLTRTLDLMGIRVPPRM
jgi:arginyl-tRNA synthetase